MGRILLVSRLAVRDLGRRRAEAALMIIIIAAATATLALGLVLGGVTGDPYAHTRALTAGPDVTAQSGASGKVAGPPASLTALEHAPGVIGYSGPYPVASPSLQANGHTVASAVAGFAAEGRDQAPASVDQPKVIQGTWVRTDAVVIEATYAAELGVRTGQMISLNGRRFRVAGLAVSAAWPSVNAPGLLWLTKADARSLATAAEPLSYLLNLKLANPGIATAFADDHSTDSLFLSSWQQISYQDGREVQLEQEALVVGSWLLSMLAIASVAVLVGGRMAEQARRVGLLKAVGGTPGLIAAVLLAEHLALALIAAAAGLACGWLAAPLLSSPVDGLIGTPGAPSLTVVKAGVVAAVALAVAALATFVPAIRAARTSTVAALADPARAPRRRGLVAAVSRWLPVPLLLGLRLAARRPRRLVLSAASIAITAAAIVGVLVIWQREHAPGVPGGLTNPVASGVSRVLLVITVVLVLLAAVNAIFVTWATVADARRPLAVARSLGATPQQVSAGVSASQLVPALPGAILGIPAGIGLAAAAGHGGSLTIPPAWSLLGVILGTALVVAGLTTIPARIGARRPVAEILRSETA